MYFVAKIIEIFRWQDVNSLCVWQHKLCLLWNKKVAFVMNNEWYVQLMLLRYWSMPKDKKNICKLLSWFILMFHVVRSPSFYALFLLLKNQPAFKSPSGFCFLSSLLVPAFLKTVWLIVFIIQATENSQATMIA